MNKMKCVWILIALWFTSPIFAHLGGHDSVKNEIFYVKNKPIEGHFLMTKNEKVFIELSNGKIISAPLTDFSFENQNNLSQKITLTKQLNHKKNLVETKYSGLKNNLLYFFILISIIGFTFLLILNNNNQFSKYSYLLGSFVIFIYACKTTETVSPTNVTTTTIITKTDPAFVETVFSSFKTLVKTRYDDTYFYVESEGIPLHNMMLGIINWQQQVPFTAQKNLMELLCRPWMLITGIRLEQMFITITPLQFIPILLVQCVGK